MRKKLPKHNQQKQRPERKAKPAVKNKPHNPLYGMHAVQAAWLNPERKIHKFWATKSGIDSFKDVLDRAKEEGLDRPEPIIVEKHEIEKQVQHGAVHQGLVIDSVELEETHISDIMTRPDNYNLIVILDQVTDPHNIGAILRSTAAFGAKAIVAQKRHAPEITGVLAKIACGAVEHVPIVRVTNLARTMEELQENGFMCIGLDERGETTLAETPRNDKTALVMGAEGEGLRRLTRENCDHLVRLPTSGPIASLNVSNAAAVALYELIRE